MAAGRYWLTVVAAALDAPSVGRTFIFEWYEFQNIWLMPAPLQALNIN